MGMQNGLRFKSSKWNEIAVRADCIPQRMRQHCTRLTFWDIRCNCTFLHWMDVANSYAETIDNFWRNCRRTYRTCMLAYPTIRDCLNGWVGPACRRRFYCTSHSCKISHFVMNQFSERNHDIIHLNSRGLICLAMCSKTLIRRKNFLRQQTRKPLTSCFWL